MLIRGTGNIGFRLRRQEIPGFGFVEFQMPIFIDLLQSNGGELPYDLGAHALWYYYCIAYKAWKEAKEPIIYDDQLYPDFRPRNIMLAVSRLYDMHPSKITRYWEVVEQQRIVLGYSKNADLPEQYKFRYN